MEIKRNSYLEKLIEKKNNGLIKIVTGIRRCGKSYLLNNIFRDYLLENGVNENHIIFVGLDDISEKKNLEPLALYNYLKEFITDKEMYYIILDEIQLVDDFVSVLNGLLRIKNVDIYVTGSNSKFLSTDIITEFRGRGDEIKVYPLSFSEFFSISTKSKIDAWKDYILFGGFPLVIRQSSNASKMSYLESSLKNIYINDVVERNNIVNDKQMYELALIISSNIGSLCSPLKLKNTFASKGLENSISDKTIYLYLKYLEDAFIVQKSLSFDIKGKKYIDTPYKYYFTDIGMRNAFLKFRQIEENHIMENIIYNELGKRGYSVDVGNVEIRDNGTRKKLEVDFVVNKGYEKIYIQSALNIETEEKKKQEFNSLLKINDAFRKIVIVDSDTPKYQNEDGIIIMGIYDFLLDENSLN